MPIYEYRCQACGHELEALQKLSDDPLKDCPECADPALRRLMSAPSFRLKGQGWYETDFKSDKETKRNLVDSAAEKKSEKTSKDGDKSKDAEKSSKDKSSKDKSSKKTDLSSGSGKGKNSGSAAA